MTTAGDGARQRGRIGPAGGFLLTAVPGAVLGGHLPSLWWLPWLLIGVGLAGAATAAARTRGRWRVAVAVIGLLVAVTGMAGHRWQQLATGPLVALAGKGGEARMQAVVVDEPRPSPFGWMAVVRVEQVDDRRVRVRALWQGHGRLPVLGSHWSGPATARPLDEGGYGDHLRRQHVAAQVDPRGWVEAGSPGWFARSTEDLRARVREAARRGLPEAGAGLAVGLVTGDTRLLPDESEQAMLDTGLSHLTAVSGSNVALVVAGVLGLCAVLGLGLRARQVGVAIAVVWFAYLTRLEPSVLRAATMAGIVLLASVRGHPRDGRHALAAAVLVLLLVDPFLVGSLGLVLSAAATAGVLVLTAPVRRRLAALPGVSDAAPGSSRRFGDRVVDLLAVTLGAQIAVAPALLVTAGAVPLSSIPANLVAVPAAVVASTIASLAAVATLVHAGVAALLMSLAQPPLALILAVAEGLRWVGGVASWQQPLTLLGCAGAVGWLLTRPHTRPSRGAAAVTSLAVVVAGIPSMLGGMPVDGFVVTAIDVGQGDAILLETPSTRVLVDAGRDERAARWLRSAGRDELDLVVVTHFDADHSGGLPDVLDQADVGALWVSLVPGKRDAAAGVLARAAAAAIPVHMPTAGAHARIGDLLLEVLAPPAGRPYRYDEAEANEASLVLRASWRGHRVLLTGDVEEDAQRDLLAAPERLVAEVLKVPHHGAAGTLPEFVAATRASVALVSVGADNDYGHPAPETLRMLHRAGMTVRRTDRSGSVRISVPPGAPARFGAGARARAAVRDPPSD